MQIVIPVNSPKLKLNDPADSKKIGTADQKLFRNPVKKAPARPALIYLCILWTGDQRAAKLLRWLVSRSRKAKLTRHDQPGLWNANTAEDFKRVLGTKSKKEVYKVIERIKASGAMRFETGGFKGRKTTFTQPTKRFLDYLSEATTTKKAITLRAQLMFNSCHFATTHKPLKKQPGIGEKGTKGGLLGDEEGTKRGLSNTSYPLILLSSNPPKPDTSGGDKLLNKTMTKEELYELFWK